MFCNDTTMIFFNHRYGTIQQVAKVIGQVCIDFRNKVRQAKITVIAQMHFIHQEIAQRIRTVSINQWNWVDHIA